MIALMEKASRELVRPYLEEGQSTVGTRLEVSHVAASPIGAHIHAESTLVEIDRRMLTFEVKAYADGELIGEGRHQRCIIYAERFMEKSAGKAEKGLNQKLPAGHPAGSFFIFQLLTLQI